MCNVDKTCAHNINIKHVQSCQSQDQRHDSKQTYSITDMIEDYKIDNEKMNNLHLLDWFEAILPLMYHDLKECKKAKMTIREWYTKIDNSLQLKEQAMTKHMHELEINHAILGCVSRMYNHIEAIIDYLVAYNEKNESITEIEFTKQCVCCKLQYPIKMLTCQYYVPAKHALSMSACLGRDDICCNFCLTRVDTIGRHATNSDKTVSWEKLQLAYQLKYAIQHTIKMKLNWYVAWYDWSNETWRIGILNKCSSNETRMLADLKLLSNDPWNPGAHFIVKIDLKVRGSMYWFCDSGNGHEIYNDKQICIDTHNQHAMGWMNYKNRFQDDWQIPVILTRRGSLEQRPLHFWQIRNSVKLYNILVESKII